MSSNAYHFTTHWRVASTAEEVSEVLGAATDLPRWWPSVYLEEESLKLDLARRRARTPEERAAVPPPPGPTFVRRGR